jgi:hypothetical protein
LQLSHGIAGNFDSNSGIISIFNPMKNLFLSILACCFVCLASNVHSFSRGNNLTDPALINLEKKKAYTDSYIKQHGNELIVLVKIPGKKALVRVKGDHWPDEIEYTYNILKDHSGKIIFIAQTPYSESGDSNIEYRHYFDEQGKAYAFSSEESIFNGNIKGGVIRKMLLKYFDADSKAISETNTLMDKDNKQIKKDPKHFDFSDDAYIIYKNLSDCLIGYKIQSP